MFDVDEFRRLEALRAYDILDTEPEAAFDRLTAVAAGLFETPVSLVSLVDETRQWFKSCHGLAVSETPRDIAFCDYAIRGEDVLVVPDATRDPRFRSNPLVTGNPHIRFYAGAPLRTPGGQTLGTAPGQKPRHAIERNYLRRPMLPSHCLSAMCPMLTNSSRVL
jgi:two-component system, sensor histidine kinase and response regulator